jgi:hypothetical protein
VELGFSARDIGTVAVGNSGNPWWSAFLQAYEKLDNGFGQTKLPGITNVLFLQDL